MFPRNDGIAGVSTPQPSAPSILVGYDGSSCAEYAINVGALLFPAAAAQVAHVWLPGFPSTGLRMRLERQASTINELLDLLEREGQLEAEQTAERGVTIARQAGWSSVTSLVERNVGDTGFAFALLAERLAPAAVIVGARGLSGTSAVLGSMSDSTVHYSPVPVLVVPEPKLTGEYRGAQHGPVVVGDDGSPSAARAVRAAAQLFPDRRLVIAVVGDCEASDDARDLVEAGTAEIVSIERQGSWMRPGRTVADALSELAGELGAAVVAVGSQGHSARRELLLGSVAKAVLHRVQRPVLVVPHRADDEN